MNPDAYVRDYLAPLSADSRAVAGEPLERFPQDALRWHSYPRDASSTLAGLSKGDLLRVLGDELGVPQDERLSVASLRSKLAEPVRRADALRQELERTRGELARVRHQLEHMQASRSWRLTAPLRHLLRMARRHGQRGGQD